jgi:tripartite-type tricarboxylate transporter receptor subunit TctC
MKAVRFLLTRAVMALTLCGAIAPSVQAQNWPTRPINLVFGFGPGGSGDFVTRRFADFASKALGQPVVVESRPGSGGILAALAVSRAAPDGYTIMIHSNGTMIMRPLLDPALGFDAVKGFTPIGPIGGSPNVILAGAKFPVRTVAEMVTWAKKNPGIMTIGHPGLGTAGHLAALLMASKANIKANFIAYRDYAQILPDLLGGQIDLGSGGYTPLFKQANILAVLAEEPVDFLPGVPSMREAGLPGVYASTWWGLYGPPSLPPDIVAKLNAVMNAFLRNEDTRQQLAKFGFQGQGGTPEDLIRKMADEKTLWAKVVEDGNIKLSDQK